MNRSAYLYKYPIVYLHGRVVWRLADLRSTPPYLNQFSREGDRSSEGIILSKQSSWVRPPLQNLNAFKMYLEKIFKCYLNHF